MAGGRRRSEALYKWNVGQMLSPFPSSILLLTGSSTDCTNASPEVFHMWDPLGQVLKLDRQWVSIQKKGLGHDYCSWPGLDACCKTQTESQSFLTLRHMKKHPHSSDSHRQAWVGSVSLKPVLFPSVPLSPFPEAPCASLTARFLL